MKPRTHDSEASVGKQTGDGAHSPNGPALDAEDDDRRQRRWTTAERLLTVIAAALGVIASALGVWGARATSEVGDLRTTRDALAEERDQLGADLDAAQGRIEELETAATSTTSTTTTVPIDDTTDTTNPGLPDEAVFLNELDPVSGSADTRETELGGQRYRNVVRQELRVCGTPDKVEYNLGQDHARFTALAGLHDTVRDPTDVWRFVVTTIDATGEHVVFEKEVPFAQPAQVDVSVAGAQRLRLSIEEVEIGWTGSNCLIDDAPATWADPQLTP